ncbi:hypothetical protein BH23PAT1_BH23PAT1_4530 [soil metagenome]
MSSVNVETLGIEQERQPIPVTERVLTEVDHLGANRLSDGKYPEAVLQDVLTNLTTAVQEAAMPYAVTTTEQEVVVDEMTRRRTFMWLGRTAVETALSGYAFHAHEAARKRVAVEVDEAEHAEANLRPGVMKVFISPRMSPRDASHKVAEQEHLADDDAVRVSWLENDESVNTAKRVLQSLLVRDIPLDAWVAMLADDKSPFGKRITVENPDSALSVMEVHRELEVPIGRLAEGPVSVVEAVLPYISDESVKAGVAMQLELYRVDQADLQRKAERIAQRWLRFEAALDESLQQHETNFEVKRFISGLQHNWGEADSRLLRAHQLPDGGYRMSRELAVILEKAKRNTLWAPAAVITGNQEVLDQMSTSVAERIYRNEMSIQQAQISGIDYRLVEAQSNRLVATQNIETRGGCSGSSRPDFRGRLGRMPGDGAEGDDIDENGSDSRDSETWTWKKGICRIKSCPTRPGKTDVGPCEICRECQSKFDDGEDPSKEVAVSNPPAKDSGTIRGQNFSLIGRQPFKEERKAA